MSNHDRQVVLSYLRSIEFIWMGSPIKKWWFGETIGWTVFASSIMRKPYTLERLKNEIEENDLPLEIVDSHDMKNSFKVFLKDAV